MTQWTTNHLRAYCSSMEWSAKAMIDVLRKTNVILQLVWIIDKMSSWWLRSTGTTWRWLNTWRFLLSLLFQEPRPELRQRLFPCPTAWKVLGRQLWRTGRSMPRRDGDFRSWIRSTWPCKTRLFLLLCWKLVQEPRKPYCRCWLTVWPFQ